MKDQKMMGQELMAQRVNNLKSIEFSAVDKPGFWERNGYHNRGDPWKVERYWGD